MIRPLRPILKSRRRLAAQEGITIVVVLGVMLTTSLLITAAFTAARGEVHLTSADTAQKEAYYAAIAGINNYAFHLTQNPNYLTYCTSPPVANAALNQYYKTGTETPIAAHELSTVQVPGTSNEKYAIQLIPAKSHPASEQFCEKENHVVESMIEREENEAAGSFRIQAVGFASTPGRSKPVERAVVATFRNIGFASFVYYTEYETEPPVIYNERTEAEQEECRAVYGSRPSFCENVIFVGKDQIKGPMHTEDHVGICGSPEFGRNKRDRIEFGSKYKGDKGYSNEGACTEEAKPVFNGTEILPEDVPSIKPPPSNTELELIAKEESGEPDHFSGRTEITLEKTKMTVIDEGVKHSGISFPANGVLYVSNTSCGYTYTPYNPSYSEDKGCGDVYVHGEYEQSLTIGAQNDIIITGNITTPHSGSTASGHALLGLVANNFVRIYHPVTGWSEGHSGTTCTDTSEDPKDLEIWAATLAVNDSFIVDNFNCGAALGSLTVHGALAQIFRGPVGTFNSGTGTIATGYEKSYEYDERLRAAEPPHFLSPVEASWHIQRETLAKNPEY